MHQWGRDPGASLPGRDASQTRPSCKVYGCGLLSAMYSVLVYTAPMSHCNITQHDTAQQRRRASAIPRHAGEHSARCVCVHYVYVPCGR